MSVYKDKERGTWYAVFKTKDPVTDKVVWVKKRGFKYKREASDWENEAKKERTGRGSGVTFREMVKLWEGYTQASAHMHRKHDEHFTKRFSEFYDTPIDSITKKDLVEWRNSLASLDYATRTLNTTIQYVKSVFKYANDVYDIKNPAIFLKPLKMSNEEIMKEMDVWTPEEFNRFAECVDLPIYRLFFTALFWTGMRKGEAIALQKSDYTDGWLFIHATQEQRSEGLRPTKTKQSRKIRVDDALAVRLEELAKRPGSYLFGDEGGLSPTMIQKQYDAAVERSGVKRIRIHDLRHSHATWLINNGVNIVAVSKRLGHSNVNQTLKTYTHLLQDSDDRLMDTINAAVSEIPW